MSKDKQNQSEIEPVAAEVLQQEAPVEQPEQPVEQPQVEQPEPPVEAIEDDPTAVKLTVLIVCTQSSGELLRYCLRSLQNLRGIDAEIKVTGTDKPAWLPHEMFTFVEAAGSIPYVELVNGALSSEWNRVVLMTDKTFILNPVTFADIAINKALPERPDKNNNAVRILKALDYDGRIEDYNTHTPLYTFKSQLEQVLFAMAGTKIPTTDIATVYCNLMYRDVKPLYLNWRNDPWILPVVTEKPSKSVVMDYVKRKKFLYMQRCNEHLLDILATLFPTPCEAEIPDENNE